MKKEWFESYNDQDPVPVPDRPIISIDDQNRAYAETCLKIIGGVITQYDQRKLYGFRCFINDVEYWFNRKTLKTLKIFFVTKGMSNRAFHNTFETALGITLNSTIL